MIPALSLHLLLLSLFQLSSQKTLKLASSLSNYRGPPLEGEHQAELERQRWAAQMEQWEREEAERRAAEALKDSKEELLEIIEMWATSKRLVEFFADAERRLEDLPEDLRVQTMERLQRARKLIGSTDALERFQSWKAPEER